jgi:hypothetical protein
VLVLLVRNNKAKRRKWGSGVKNYNYHDRVLLREQPLLLLLILLRRLSLVSLRVCFINKALGRNTYGSAGPTSGRRMDGLALPWSSALGLVLLVLIVVTDSILSGWLRISWA